MLEQTSNINAPRGSAVTDFPRSLIEFQRCFPDEAACATYLFAARWPHGFVCPGCGKTKAWELQTKPSTWECAGCRKQTSVTAGTIMHHSKLPLTTWFWAAYLMATHSNGISALQLQRQLALGSYKSAWLLCAKLRRSMLAPGRTPLAGLAEVDETELPCRSKNDPHRRPRARPSRQDPRRRRRRGAGRRCRPRPHPPQRDTRLLGRQSARLPSRPSRPRYHRQDRRVAQLCRRLQRPS